MFLELMAWAVVQAEAARTRPEFHTFETELQRVRLTEGWGPTPWPNATDRERFEKYVADFAASFTDDGWTYPGRLLVEND